MFRLLFLVLPVLVIAGGVFAVAGTRRAARNAKSRSPVPQEFKRAQRTRILRWVGAAAAIAIAGSLWAYFVRDPLPRDMGWF